MPDTAMSHLMSKGSQGGHSHALARAAFVFPVVVLAASLSSCGVALDGPAGALLAGSGASGSLLASAPSGGPAQAGTFRIAGSAAELYPGHTAQLKLTVTNPWTFGIVVTSLTVVVHNASVDCTGTNLVASAFAGKLSVAAHRSAKVILHLSMHQSAPNACEGVRFPLWYRGLAKRT
jgi:hypothetical protein